MKYINQYIISSIVLFYNTFAMSFPLFYIG